MKGSLSFRGQQPIVLEMMHEKSKGKAFGQKSLGESDKLSLECFATTELIPELSF
jgi:hypothetical protein